MYVVNGKEYSENSTMNQKIMEQFVSHHVRACVTSMVEYILDTADLQNDPPFTIDDIEVVKTIRCPKCGEFTAFEPIVVQDTDLTVEFDPEIPGLGYCCPVCEYPYDNAEDARACCMGMDAYRCPNCGKLVPETDYLDEVSQHVNSIMEWWLVSSTFCDKLAEYGEAVIPSEALWGRQTSGQAIHMDGIISKICKDLEILEGQKYDWSTYLKTT